MTVSSKTLATTANTITSVDELILPELHPLILDYLIEIIAENRYTYNRKSTFLNNIAAAYATYISHNLVWNIKVDETLAFATQQPQSLLIEVEIKDPHEQRMRGTTLKMLRMVGDCDPRDLKPDEKPYGLVQRIKPAFSSMPQEYYRQSEEWHRHKDSKEAARIKERVVTAIETLCIKICDSKEITDYKDFETYLNSPMAEEFRCAIKPDPTHVVTEGFVWPFEIFLEFFRVFETYANNDKVKDKTRANLGGWWSLKSDVFDAIVYPALWGRVPRNDLAHAKKGIGNIDNGALPARIDFSNGVPDELVCFGRQFFFGLFGDKFATSQGRRGAGFSTHALESARTTAEHFFKTYIKQKHHTVESSSNNSPQLNL